MTDVIQERIKSLEQQLAAEPQSPLFARLASYYLQTGRTSDALRLCDDGIAIYPFYSTAHLVKGKALVKLGMMAEAKHEYEVVHEMLPTNEILARLASSIDVGSSVEFGAAPAKDAAPEPEVSSASSTIEEAAAEEPQLLAAKDILQQEPPAREESIAPTETVPAPELPAEEPQAALPVETVPLGEDSYGFQGPLAVEEEQPPPSGLGAPGFGLEEKAQPVTSDADISSVPEAPTVTAASIEEPQAPATDYGFGAHEEAAPVEPATEEAPFVPETVESSPPIATEESFGAAIEAPPTPPVVEATPLAEPPATLTPPISEPATAEVPPAKEVQTPDWFEVFDQLQQPSAETTEASPASPAEEENPCGVFATEQTPAATGEEPYEEFAARVRTELFGTEDTMTLDEYLGASSSVKSPAARDQIGEIAEKLKSSPRITPPSIDYSEKAPRPATEGDVASGSGFVTPTLAEIYVKQGWLDDAIKAYRSLIVNKPAEKERFEQRIAEIEEMKKKQYEVRRKK
jgi:hypothetical protein